MKLFNNSILEKEFALKAFKTAIEHQDWTVDELKEFLIQEKKNHMVEINDLVTHLKMHGIEGFCIYVENGGSNDVTWHFQYLNEHIAKAYKETITPRVGYYISKAIRESEGV